METTVGRQAARHQEERSALPQFSVGSGTCGLAAGADKAVALLQRELAARGLEAVVKQVGCVGMCHWEPIVDIRLPGKPRLSFGPCTERNLKRVLHEYVDHGIVPGDLLLGVVVEPGEPTPAPEALEALIQPGPDEPAAPGRLPLLREHPMMRHQVRIVLSNCGLIDPGSLDEYLASGGYQALEKALTQMTPEQVIDEVSTSGLRGRGGAGFPTGKKWALTRQSPGTEKYMVCNADEGDPGAFMDRSILEGDPFRVLEGMTIGAYAVGAQKGFIYVRAEYPLAIQRLQTAIERARAAGYLGERILGTDFSFDIQLKIGAGAFVCGEETALIASIEGKRGMPRPGPLPGGAGGLRQAHQHQQRGDLRQRARHHPAGRPVVRLHRHRDEQGNQGLRPERQGALAWAYRGAHGHAGPDHHRGDRRRRGRGAYLQGRPDGRPLGRLLA